MAGKREKKGNRLRLSGMVVLLAAVGLLLAAGGPSGVAADSPAETPGAPAPAVVPAVAPEPVAVEKITPFAVEAPEKEKEPFGPVKEGAPVEDTYFDTAAFLGDSRTEGFKLYSGLENGSYYYAMGATVESVFTKKVETAAGEMPLLDAVAAGDFDRIYVMLGVNELGWKGTQFFFDRYEQVIDRLQADHPDAKVVLQTILPVSAKQEAKKSYVNNARIAEYNEAIRVLAEVKGCAYLDVAAAVTDETGCLRSNWTYDGVHLNTAGCKAWLDYLKTHPVS